MNKHKHLALKYAQNTCEYCIFIFLKKYLVSSIKLTNFATESKQFFTFFILYGFNKKPQPPYCETNFVQLTQLKNMSAHKENLSLSDELHHATEVKSAKCYQCGKCSAGCPVSTEMEYPPSVVMRMLQTEDPVNDKKLLKSETIWLCVSCEMCLSRCPMEIDIPKAMDFMRQQSLKKDLSHPKSKNIINFHKAFLDSIKYTGRLHEISLVADYKLRSMQLMQDVSMVPGMLSRGKLPIMPETIKERKKIARIFKKSKNK